MRNYFIKLRMPNVHLYPYGANRKTYGLFNLMVSTLWENISTYFVKVNKSTFPRCIGDFRFVSLMRKKGFKKSYMLAIYVNQKGEKAIAKMLNTKIKGYHYYSLLNEIAVYEVLNSVTKRIKKNIPGKFWDIYVPKLISRIETKDTLIALIEFVKGETADNFSPQKKVDLYFKIADYLSFVGLHLTNEEKEKISKRKAADYIFLYPFLLLKAMYKCPKAITCLLKGAFVLTTNIPDVFSSCKYTLVHRDLHFANILVSSQRIFLIDLQFCVFTESLHESITTLRYFWKEDDFHKLFLQEIYKRYEHRRNFNSLFKTFIINSVTHGLIDSSFPKKTIDKWVEFLKFGLALKS